MSFLELTALVFENLGRRKGRVALTAIGVVIGTVAVVVLVSLGIGLQANATRNLYGISDLSRIDVSPNYGGEGPIVIGGGLGGGGGGGGGVDTGQVLITDDTLATMAALPNVRTVIARDWLQSGAVLRVSRMETYAGVQGVDVRDISEMGVTAAQGETLLDRGEVIVGYSVPMQFYSPSLRPGQEPPPPPDLLNSAVTLVLFKYTDTGEVTRMYRVNVVGILAETRSDHDWSVFMTMDDVTAMNEWVVGGRINRDKVGYSSAIVRAEDASKALEVADAIKALGLQAYAAQEPVQGINNFFIIMQLTFGGVGAIALVVAALGIANSMTMAVLERTREIGLMKAIGATNRDVLSIFLGEAAGIGFIGGLGGIVLGWSAGQVINVFALVYLTQQAAQNGMPPPESAVVTPTWLPVFAIVFATLIGLLSGIYPALRAANMVPVNALKYE